MPTSGWLSFQLIRYMISFCAVLLCLVSLFHFLIWLAFNLRHWCVRRSRCKPPIPSFFLIKSSFHNLSQIKVTATLNYDFYIARLHAYNAQMIRSPSKPSQSVWVQRHPPHRVVGCRWNQWHSIQNWIGGFKLWPTFSIIWINWCE